MVHKFHGGATNRGTTGIDGKYVQLSKNVRAVDEKI